MKQEMINENTEHPELFEYLSKLDITQFKLFYGAFVYCWGNLRCFISKQSFFDLWCEFNLLCHELDESFPDQFDDHDAIRDFCNAHPYYFIDRLPIALIARLFADHVDNRIDILTNIAKLVYESDLRAVYTYVTQMLGLKEPVDELVAQAHDHVKLHQGK